MKAQGLGRVIFKIDNVTPLRAEKIGKRVVLLLGKREIRDIVKEQALELLRHQMLQLAPGTVQQHTAQRADLAADRYRHGITSPLLFYLLFGHLQPL